MNWITALRVTAFLLAFDRRRRYRGKVGVRVVRKGNELHR